MSGGGLILDASETLSLINNRIGNNASSRNDGGAVFIGEIVR
jgi:hypothetical protein